MQRRIRAFCVIIGACLAAQAVAQDAPARKPIDSPPYVFAGIRYGAPFAEAVKVFGQPESVDDDATASTRLSWAGGKFQVSYYESSGFINGFTVVGRDGALWVLEKAKEPMLRLLGWTKEEVVRNMGPPGKIWLNDTRLTWNYAVDKRTASSVFLECTSGPQQPCDEMQVHWTGTGIWDPNDGVDALGMRTDPICSIGDSATRNFAKELPTGIKASSEKWRMEIYENADTGSWSLLGADRAKLKLADTLERCTLARGTERRGYLETGWYRAYFTR